MVCSGGDFGDQLDFKPYAQTGEKKYTEIIHTSHGALRTSPQRAYCEASGIPYDKSCITPERMIFITDKDSEIYRSKEWYGVLPAEDI